MNTSELNIQITSPVFVVERQPDAAWKLDNPGYPDSYVLAYAVSGSVIYTFDGQRQTVKRGNVVFVRQGEAYQAVSDPDDPWSFYSCGFGIEVCDEASRQILESLPHVFRCSGSSHMQSCFAELNRIWTTRQAGYLLKCRSLLLDILYLLLGDEKRRDLHSAHFQTITGIVETMRCSYSRSYSLEELCRMSGLSSSHFRTLFKQVTGVTAVQFQNRLKIDKAKDLIISHTCNVTEAAEAVGFRDVNYFSRIFKQLTGKSPSEYL
ncbi:MAG: helix-turn-helix transcriptional regulator [Clostridia bacterium]|nr:helix-turn-helix transcriptional regulator [Clostridia bacterium]